MTIRLVFPLLLTFFLLDCKQQSAPTEEVKEEFHNGTVVGRIILDKYDAANRRIYLDPMPNETVYLGKLDPWDVTSELTTNSDGYYIDNKVPIGLIDVWLSRSVYVKNLVVNENIVTTVRDMVYESSSLYFFGNVIESGRSEIRVYLNLQVDNNGVPIIGGKSSILEYFTQGFFFQADSITKRYAASFAVFPGRLDDNIIFYRRYNLTTQWLVCNYSDIHSCYNIDLDFSNGAYVRTIYLPKFNQ